MGERDEKRGGGARLTSVELAELVIDALLRASIVDEKHVKRAISIAAEEIEVRKVFGDY